MQKQLSNSPIGYSNIDIADATTDKSASENNVSNVVFNGYRTISDKYYSILKKIVAGEPTASDKYFGRFFTNPEMINEILDEIIDRLRTRGSIQKLSIIDPFAGDGRLVYRLIERLATSGLLNRSTFVSVTMIDIDGSKISEAKDKIIAVLSRYGNSVNIETNETDSFLDQRDQEFDICITNPPWCILKPIRRSGNAKISSNDLESYNNIIRSYQGMLRDLFPAATRGVGFSRNCINLSRCGLSKAQKFVKKGGILAIVMPATIFSDQQSHDLRRDIFENWSVNKITYYPAECKLFGHVDQTSITLVATNVQSKRPKFTITCYNKKLEKRVDICNASDLRFIKRQDYVVPFSYKKTQWRVLNKFAKYSTLGEVKDIFFARELDETRIDEQLSSEGTIRFIKGFMIDRFVSEDIGFRYLKNANKSLPESVFLPKIVWRDVSRESQTRRIKATIITDSFIAGNSLGVVYLKPRNDIFLSFLLAVINSYVFEFQARLHLISNHVPVGVIKRIKIPAADDFSLIESISSTVYNVVKHTKSREEEAKLECLVAKAYNLSFEDFLEILGLFKIDEQDMSALVKFAKVILPTGDSM